MQRSKKIILSAAVAACFASNPYWRAPLQAAELNTNIPKSDEEIVLGQKITVNLPAQPLAASLKALSAKIGLNITYNDKLVSDKQAPALSGSMRSKEALQKLLANTGLEAKLNDQTLYIQRIPMRAEDKSVEIDKVEVRAKKFYEIGPMPGLALTKEEIPGNVQSISAKEIKESHSVSISDLMNRNLQSISVNDYQSNPFQMDVNYRGFTASPQLGTAQGISVFFDGIRVNEPFGDVVNWDMIPMNALAGIDVFPGSNPIFGLGTLGGAISMRTKSGFDGKSLDAEVLTGAFGRKQLQISAGGNNGVIAGFVSGNFFLEDGWRNDSPSKVNQVFGKAEWQNDRARLGLSMLYAGNKLTGNGLLPQQMVDQNPKQVYTSPDESKNDLFQFQLSGIWDVTDTFNITGQIYKRNSKRKTSTSDVNENFGGTRGRSNLATVRDRNRQLLSGLRDENRDGKPDYNNYAMNVASDAADNPLATEEVLDGSGNVIDIKVVPCTDPSAPCASRLIYGTNFGTQAQYLDENNQWQNVTDQDRVTAADGSGNQVWKWTYHPAINTENIQEDPSNAPRVFNEPVTAEYDQLVRFANANYGLLLAGLSIGSLGGRLQSNIPHPGTGAPTYNYNIGNAMGLAGTDGSYTDNEGFYHYFQELYTPINSANLTNPITAVGGLSTIASIGPLAVDSAGNTIYRDGAMGAANGSLDSGYMEGTPTAIFTDTNIDQAGTGGALQLNWNLDKHKVMVGSSIDKSDSLYDSKQYLGLLDSNRHGFVAPDLLGWEYYANSPAFGVGLNDFSGKSMTKSIYASETWSPTKNLSITAAARFNHTAVENKLAVNALTSFSDVNSILNFLNLINLCTDNDNNGTIDASECPNGLDGNIVPFNPAVLPSTAQGQNVGDFRPPETDKFKYRSFNPSLGITWQAREDLNLYGNIGRGARTPTVIELGCAFDPRPLPGSNIPRSIEEQRTCTLPGALSGDPYLKQVRSTSYEIGVRGKLADNIEWNTSLYRTDLTDDIYFVAVNATDSFFQNVGNTRRQGLELGLKGKWGKARFGFNYAFTDATFQSAIKLASPHNSSADPREIIDDGGVNNVGQPIDILNPDYQQIKVKPGNRLPGIPLHNLNFNFAYEITDNWTVGLNAIMHSSAFVRGNENNQHRAGPAEPLVLICPAIPGQPASGICPVARADFGDGKTSGYTVFNFRTSYKISPEWTFGMQVNNLFDKDYASAGRLGLNAFSPSIRGVIGESGFNYNSADWQGSSFLGTGAPRSAFVTLSYEFQPKKLDLIE
ncbi:TonB-dependent receptor domain-containing protein [Methylophilus luteus]|uniref:TonB-dependent receptor domain-containing protein n=1 Tax=Methylophilus luteus TaxID=640108 RepID=A0ABW3F3E9_9PROT